MRHRVGRAGFAVVCAAATGALLWALPVATTMASSHREAPLITEMPRSMGRISTCSAVTNPAEMPT